MKIAEVFITPGFQFDGDYKHELDQPLALIMLFQPDLIDWLEFKKKQRSNKSQLGRGRP